VTIVVPDEMIAGVDTISQITMTLVVVNAADDTELASVPATVSLSLALN